MKADRDEVDRLLHKWWTSNDLWDCSSSAIHLISVHFLHPPPPQPQPLCRDALSDVWRWLLWWPPRTIRCGSSVWEVQMQRQCGPERAGSVWPHKWAVPQMPWAHGGPPLRTLPVGVLRWRPGCHSQEKMQTWEMKDSNNFFSFLGRVCKHHDLNSFDGDSYLST